MVFVGVGLVPNSQWLRNNHKWKYSVSKVNIISLLENVVGVGWLTPTTYIQLAGAGSIKIINYQAALLHLFVLAVLMAHSKLPYAAGFPKCD